mgnify:CR=1 FL=1|tara:strand:+ start:153 stop:440 length:288 start_codon:yes stop_codon:yes gene_type:complete
MSSLKLEKLIEIRLNDLGFTGYTIGEGKLMAVELMAKVGAGCYVSCTENQFINSIGLLKSDDTPNKKGRRFLMSMLYASSNERPEIYGLMTKHRQ